jgi:hypothetical protein
VKTLTLGEIVNADETRAATAIFQDAVTRIEKEIITPALPRINAWTGQQNDPRFLAYMVIIAIVSIADEKAAREMKRS